MMRGVVGTEHAFVGRSEVVDGKDKKKKRRSNRKSRQNSSFPASCSVNEPHLEAPTLLATAGPSNFEMPNEVPLPTAPHVSFSSMPTMHLFEQVVTPEVDLPNRHMMSTDCGENLVSTSCPKTIVGERLTNSHARKNVLLSHPTEFHGQRKLFASHWSFEAVNEGLERGNVFKALFHVNAHNRLEAYCKVDGVPTDILISGILSQNRAVEGDTVAIEVDPFSLWSKMKGSSGASSSPVIDDSNFISGFSETVLDGCIGTNKVDRFNECISSRNGIPFLEFQNSTSENGGPDLAAVSSNGHSNRSYCCVSEPSATGPSIDQNGLVTSVEKLCDLISSCPSKRPTGRVVSIVEMSARRTKVVGFLSVKQWLKENHKKAKKNKILLLSSNCEHISLTPTNPKLPKMLVPLRSLPDCINHRLESGDEALGAELVAAQIVDWVEDFDLPIAHVSHIFGRGREIEPQIAAILFENAINSSDFSPEVLSCLPKDPWKITLEELQSRRDIRHLCIFTIDPANATDLDDALSVESLSNDIYRVGVHIADISYFVIPNTALDVEAQIRSTSVYLIQRKLPMLPSLLSDNLGSLNPGVDRLTFSLFWDIDLTGKVIDRWIGRTVVNSSCKLSYDHAKDIIDGHFEGGRIEIGFPQLHGNFEWSDVISSVQNLHKISKVLKEKRFRDGALSLENPKVSFLSDKDGFPYDCMRSGRKSSNFLVEEIMLLANRTAAEVITRAYPFSSLLRKHPEPKLRKLREFESFCSKHGLVLDTSTSGLFHNSLERIKVELKNDSVLFDVLMSYATRPMQLATYFCTGDLNGTENSWGHYALAIPLYTHFTSPLRRYPDIIVHRTLAAVLEAEQTYLQYKRKIFPNGKDVPRRCFTGLDFDKDVIESLEAQNALCEAALRHSVPCTAILVDVAAHCNERMLASRHVEDAMDKLYMWVLLRKKEILFSEARVLALGPRFMTLYVCKLAIERRIYYDEFDGLVAEWLETTSTLVLSLSMSKRFQRKGNASRFKALEDVALMIDPYDLQDLDAYKDSGNYAPQIEKDGSRSENPFTQDVEPAFFPLTIRLLSTIPIALHGIGGDDGPIDIGARLYTSSYFFQC